MNISKIEIALSSPAFWSLIGVFVYGGLEALAPGLGGTAGEIVQGALVVLAMFLHTGSIQKAAATGRINGRVVR